MCTSKSSLRYHEIRMFNKEGEGGEGFVSREGLLNVGSKSTSLWVSFGMNRKLFPVFQNGSKKPEILTCIA
jgi:hypothetical protein